MEPAILGVLAIMLTVMLYLDRTRRADIGDMRADHAGLRADMSAEIAALRKDMNDGFAALRNEMSANTAALRDEMNANTAALRDEINANTAALRDEINANTAALRDEINAGFSRTDARIDQLTTAVINLAESLGQVKGRTEVLVASE